MRQPADDIGGNEVGNNLKQFKRYPAPPTLDHLFQDGCGEKAGSDKNALSFPSHSLCQNPLRCHMEHFGRGRFSDFVETNTGPYCQKSTPLHRPATAGRTLRTFRSRVCKPLQPDCAQDAREYSTINIVPMGPRGPTGLVRVIKF